MAECFHTIASHAHGNLRTRGFPRSTGDFDAFDAPWQIGVGAFKNQPSIAVGTDRQIRFSGSRERIHLQFPTGVQQVGVLGFDGLKFRAFADGRDGCLVRRRIDPFDSRVVDSIMMNRRQLLRRATAAGVGQLFECLPGVQQSRVVAGIQEADQVVIKFFSVPVISFDKLTSRSIVRILFSACSLRSWACLTSCRSTGANLASEGLADLVKSAMGWIAFFR